MASCWYPDEALAAQVKDFQYMLMVGSLQCKATSGVYGESYNAFVAKQRGVLDSKGYTLKAHFLRENGIQGGRAAYDSYNTTLSNRHAGRFDDASFCMTITAYTRMAATASDTDFIALVQSTIEPPRGTCGNAAYVSPEPEPQLTPRRTESAYAPEPVYAPQGGYGVVAGSGAPSPYGHYPADGPQAAYAPPPNAPQQGYYPQPAAAALSPYGAQPVDVADAGYPAEPAYAPPAVQPAYPQDGGYADDDRAVAAAAPRARPRAIPAAATTVIAPSPIVPPDEGAGTQSQGEALQAAIAALQAATEALKAQTRPSN
ncbi:MAG: hypothetical protein ACRYG4_02255 [Janthinobacterium lividum]